MLVNFLQAPIPLTKSFINLGRAGIEKSPYPNVYAVTSHEEQVTSLNDFHACLNAHAAAGHCLLKGTVGRPLVNESRAGSTTAGALTQWLCLDFDKVPNTYTQADGTTIQVTPEYLLDQLGLGSVSYILQWSASQGITSQDTLSFHGFVLLTQPVAAPIIKQWLIQQNHAVPALRACQALTKTGSAITWGLDITACQNDKLIYIAPPILKNVKSTLKGPRIALIKKAKDKFTFPSSTATTEANRALTDARINELRELAGLPSRKFTYKRLSSTDILTKPEACTITETRSERGFVYFNLNGGDSWAYYHPEDRPDIIYNFKGEPNYLTKELLPDYWESLTSQASRTSSDGLMYLVFLDRRSGTYYRGTYNQADDILDLTPAKNETQVRHFAEQYGVPLGSYIPEWDLTFNPHDSVRVDPVNKTINTFQLTQYMKAKPKRVTKCPPTIFKVIHHALGSDADCTEHFINWLAYILQERTRTLTAWVLHGVEGTGKGTLMTKILRPLFGSSQTTVRRMEELNEQYNGWMSRCFLVFVDEIEAKALVNVSAVMAKLRTFITEPTVPIRQMYSQAVEADNFTNWIFNSNRPEPVVIPPNDRRYNVGKYQTQKLIISEAEREELIAAELQAFHDFLYHYPVDKTAASTPLDNEDRKAMIAIGESSIDTVVSQLLDVGSMEFFLDQLPDTAAYSGDAATRVRIDHYRHAMQTIMARTDLSTGQCNISRDELYIILNYVVGKMPDSPNKFTSLLKHHRIHTSRVRCGDKPVYGIRVVFKDVKKFRDLAALHFPAPPATPKKGTR